MSTTHSDLRVREIPVIDWVLLRDHLGLPIAQHLSGSPEAMIHELCHAYDCMGNRAFDFVGSQDDVNNLIKAKYGDRTAESDIAEIKVSAMTLLVLQYLGESDLEEVISTMYMNIKSDGFTKDREPLFLFFSFVKDKEVIHRSLWIRNFIYKFQV